jgi:hypothetical protein
LKNRGGKPQRILKSEANKKLPLKNNSTFLPISNEEKKQILLIFSININISLNDENDF